MRESVRVRERERVSERVNEKESVRERCVGREHTVTEGVENFKKVTSNESGLV